MNAKPFVVADMIEDGKKLLALGTVEMCKEWDKVLQDLEGGRVFCKQHTQWRA